jgi:hypothetical protein
MIQQILAALATLVEDETIQAHVDSCSYHK